MTIPDRILPNITIGKYFDEIPDIGTSRHRKRVIYISLGEIHERENQNRGNGGGAKTKTENGNPNRKRKRNYDGEDLQLGIDKRPTP